MDRWYETSHGTVVAHATVPEVCLYSAKTPTAKLVSIESDGVDVVLDPLPNSVYRMRLNDTISNDPLLMIGSETESEEIACTPPKGFCEIRYEQEELAAQRQPNHRRNQAPVVQYGSMLH